MYTVRTTKHFDKQFKKLDYSVQKTLKKWIRKNLENCFDPRATGKALTENLKGYWRYGVGDYRIIAEINDNELIIFAVSVAHRSQVYK